ncbi:MAG TPA: hypothetical protein DHU96_24825 [Actinobacteria bacterium]|nr:hypothetical protein [Actinomycetota bacterium]
MGLREPIVVILLLTAFLTTISGRPVNGLLLLIVAIGLAWDAARNRRRMAAPPSAGTPAGAAPPSAGTPAGAAPAGPSQGEPGPGLLAPRRRPLITVAGVAGAAVFAAVAGSFTRYSWPATAGVAGLATVVGIGWRGPLRPRPDPGKLPVPGAVLWAGPLAAGVWELVALSLQPSLTTTSYAHPAISTLTDPVLARRP